MVTAQANKLKIWIINHYAIPPQLAGGTRHYEFAADLARKGHLVTLWMSNFYHPGKTFISKEQQAQTLEKVPDGLILKWVWSTSYLTNNFRRVLNMLTFACLMFIKGLVSRSPQVILASSPHLFAAFTGWALSFIKGVPFILEVRDLWPEALESMNQMNKPVVIIPLSWLEKYLYNRAQKIIAVTEGIHRRLLEKGIPPAKIIYIPNGVYLKGFIVRTVREQKRKELGFKNHFVIMYAGAHGLINSLVTIIMAAKVLIKRPQYLFVFVGDGMEKKNLCKLAEDWGLINIRFLDPVAKDEIADLLNAADIAVAVAPKTNLFKGARLNKLFDYMAAGKPILCAIDGESRRMVEENQVGIYVEPENPQAFAHGVEFLYYHQELFPTFFTNGQEYVENFCDREKLVVELEEVLLTVGCRGCR